MDSWLSISGLSDYGLTPELLEPFMLMLIASHNDLSVYHYIYFSNVYVILYIDLQ